LIIFRRNNCGDIRGNSFRLARGTTHQKTDGQKDEGSMGFRGLRGILYQILRTFEAHLRDGNWKTNKSYQVWQKGSEEEGVCIRFTLVSPSISFPLGV
jgi:hypothetical protein